MNRILPALLLLAAPGAASALSAIAEQEMAALSTALQLAVVDTTYLTTLENLDDGPFPNPNAPHQFIDDSGGALVVLPARGTVERVALASRPPGLEWQGPYISYQAGRIDGPNSDYDPFTPLDPWGNPYRLYSPLGQVSPLAESITLDGYGDAFDAYTIASDGPDRQQGTADDLLRSVPVGVVTIAAISSVRLSPAEAAPGRAAAWSVEIRGYGFGAAAGAVAVAGQAFEGAVEWTPTRIRFELDEQPPADTVFEATPPGGAALSFAGWLLDAPDASVRDWQLLGP